MHIQRNFVLNIGFGRSQQVFLKSDLKNLIQKIASWYQLVLLATIANAIVAIFYSNCRFLCRIDSNK